MSQLHISLFLIILAALPCILLGLFFKTEKSHQFINGREKITDIDAYAGEVGNCLLALGFIIFVADIAFYLNVIGPISLALAVTIAGIMPIPWVWRTHKEYTLEGNG